MTGNLFQRNVESVKYMGCFRTKKMGHISMTGFVCNMEPYGSLSIEEEIMETETSDDCRFHRVPGTLSIQDDAE